MGIKCIRTEQVIQPQQPLFIYQNMIQIKKNTDPHQEYEFLQLIGKGSFSVVYRIRNRLTGNLRALKQIEKKRNFRLQKQIINEFSILRQLDHPNIMKMYEYFEDENYIYIVAELCPGKEFFEYIVENKYIKEAKARSIFYELVCSVSYMHQHHIMHRDLKPENILYDPQKGIIKVVDLGSALQFNNSDIVERKRAGTSYYIAPEVLNRSYNQKCDIWSLGVILYIMLSGEPPFKGASDNEILQKVKTVSVEFKKSVWTIISEPAKLLIKGMLERSIKKRLNLHQILEHEWFKLLLVEKEKTPLNEQQHKSMISCLSNLRSFKDVKGQSLQEGIITFIVNFVRNNEDASQLQQSFKTLDLNGDGVLSQEELTLGMMKFLKTKKRQASAIAEAVFKKADKNRSGYIDYSQFVVAASNFELTVSAQNLDIAFNYLDTDGSGKISAIQLKNQLGTNIPQQTYQNMLKSFDVNSDGQISREQFREMMKKMIQYS